MMVRRWLLATLATAHAFDAFDARDASSGQPSDHFLRGPIDAQAFGQPPPVDDFLHGGSGANAYDDGGSGTDAYEDDGGPEDWPSDGCVRYVHNVLARRGFCVVNSTWADEFVQRVAGFTVGWEPRTRQRIHAALAKVVAAGNTTTTLEAGMHVGDHLLPLAAAFPSLSFVGVDPDSIKCDFVREMALLNNLTNVKVHQHGLAARDRGCALDVSDANPGGWTIAERRLTLQRLTCRTVDSFDLPDLGLLHLDVEGAELRALRGARATLRSARPLVVFENNHLSKDTRYGTAALLEAHGYAKRAEVEHNEFWAPSVDLGGGRRLRRPRRPRGS